MPEGRKNAGTVRPMAALVNPHVFDVPVRLRCFIFTAVTNSGVSENTCMTINIRLLCLSAAALTGRCLVATSPPLHQPGQLMPRHLYVPQNENESAPQWWDGMTGVWPKVRNYFLIDGVAF